MGCWRKICTQSTFEYSPTIFEQVNKNVASLSNNKTVNRAATPTKAILTQLCGKKNNNKFVVVVFYQFFIEFEKCICFLVLKQKNRCTFQTL